MVDSSPPYPDDTWLLENLGRLAASRLVPRPPPVPQTRGRKWPWSPQEDEVAAATPVTAPVTSISAHELLNVLLAPDAQVSFSAVRPSRLVRAEILWSAETATTFLEVLAHLDLKPFETVQRIVAAACKQAADATAYLAGDRPSVEAALVQEAQRIAAIAVPDPKAGTGPGRPSAPAPLSPHRRQFLRNHLANFQSLEERLSKTASDLRTHEHDIDVLWRIAEVMTVAAGRSPAHTVSSVVTCLKGFHADLEQADSLLRKLGEQVADEANDRGFPAKSSAALVESVADHFRKPVDRFLELPASEAEASFQKMFASIGSSPLLGVSVLAGLVGMFAYAKALVELGRRQLGPSTLISTGDIGDFTIRLAVPFILLVVGFISLVHVWVSTLKGDHRHQRRLMLQILPGLLLLVLSCIALRLWAPIEHHAWYTDAASLFFATAGFAALFPANALLRAGSKKGVTEDDRVQLAVLCVLRTLATPIGLLIAFSVLGLVLVATNRVSVLFARDEVPELNAEFARPAKVLESKILSTPLLISPNYSRLSGAWLVKSSMAPWASASEAGEARQAPWFFVGTQDVACVREIRPRETKEKAIRNFCTNPKVELPAPLLTDTIANYAVTQLGCKRTTFEGGPPALVLSFPRSLPKTPETAMTWKPERENDLWPVPAENLMIPGLAGTRHSRSSRGGASTLVEQLSFAPSSSIWVLGFASTPGANSENLDLSERRAHALRELLLRSHKVAVSPSDGVRIKQLAMGEGPLAGLLGVQDTEEDQIAVAFFCERAS